MSEPTDAFGAHILSGTLGTIGDREIGVGHVVLSEERYEWLLARARAFEAAAPAGIAYTTVRDAGDEVHVECRFLDGQKYAAVTLDDDEKGNALAQAISTFLNVSAGRAA